MDYTKEQFEKLPKWAQDKIKYLEINNNYLEKKLLQFQGKEGTNSFIINGIKRLPLCNNAQVEFIIGFLNKNSISVYPMYDNCIYVNAHSSLGQKMVIIPNTSNSFYIGFDERQ